MATHKRKKTTGRQQASSRQQFEDRERTSRKATPRKRRKRKLVLFIIEAVIILFLIAGAFVASKFNLMDRVDFDKTGVQNESLTEETQEMLDSYTDIALFGLDNRTNGNYSSGNSDVLMIVSINNNTKELSMVSVYRDTYLDVSAKGEESKFRKANAAYAYGGPEQAITMLNNNLDLDIDEYIAFDFQAVSNAIDVLGGIEVEITNAEIKYINDYIDETNSVVGTKSPHIYTPGVQTLDGTQSVAYARIRYTAGGDFKRAERQRIVIAAALEKAKECDLKTLNELVNVVFPEIETSLSATTMIQMVTALMQYDLSNSYGFPSARCTMEHSSKGSLVVPCTLESNVIQLHEILYGTTDYEPSDLVKSYNEYIIKDTGMTEEDAFEDQFVLEEDTATE